MTFAKVGRFLLGLAAGLLVLWAFVDVGLRSFRDDRGGRKVLLRVLYSGSIEEDQIVRGMIARYEAANPDVAVQPILASNFEQKFKTMVAAGDAPDLFYLPATTVEPLVDPGLVEPLDGLIAESPAPWMDDFYPVVLNAFRYKRPGEGAAKLWGFPKDFTTFGMMVNLDLFERAGLRVPHDGWTWDEVADDARKITDLREPGNDRLFGVNLNTWSEVFGLLARSFGGELYARKPDGSYDFTKPTFTSPGVVAALDYVRRLRLVDKTAFNSTGIARDGGNEFLTGNIGIIGPIGRWIVPTYRASPTLRFDFVPLPHAQGVAPVGHTTTYAWAMAAASENKPEAFELLKYLCGPEGQTQIAQLGLAVPSLRSVAESDAFLSPGQQPAHARLFLDVVPQSPVRKAPRQEEVNQILDGQVSAAAQLGSRTPLAAMESAEAQWKRVIGSPLQTEEFPRVAWAPILAAAGGIVALAAVVLFLLSRRERLGAIDAAQERAGFLFISPWLLGFALLTLGPMVLSLILAFTRWSAMTPVADAEFVGLRNFAYLFAGDESFYKSLRVTAYYVVLAVPITQAAALLVAVLMNANVRGIGLFRTVYFLPSVITGVAMGTLWLALFNNDFGLINEVLRRPLGWVGLSPPDWFGTDAGYAAIPAFVIMSVWGVGGAMVIYLAGLKSIPQSLYEAGTIDGTGPLRRFWNITLPMLSPLVFFNLVMGIIGSFQVFTQAFVMTGRGPDDSTLFYVLNLYYQAFESHNMGYASAMAWVLFVIILAFTLLVFRGSRRFVYYEGLR